MQEEASQFIPLCRQLIDQKEYQEVINLCQEKLNDYPDSDALYTLLSWVSYLLKDYQQAADYADKALVINKNNFNALITLALTHSRKRNSPLNTTISLWERIITLEPETVFAYVNLGESLFRRGTIRNATESLKKAVNLDPTYARAYYDLGIINLTQLDETSSLQEFKKAYTFDNELQFSIKLIKGECYLKMKDYKKALEKFHTLLAVYPDSPRIHYDLTLAYWLSNKKITAFRHYHTAIELDPKEKEFFWSKLEEQRVN